jgi:uncharacterized protein (TIGR03435 family)
MPAGVDPAFEVATIRPSDPANGSSGFQTRGRRLFVLNETVDSMLVFAYGVQRRQIVNEPTWLGTDHYDIEGLPDITGMPNVDQYRVMLRKLLADRFHLVLHREQREMGIYALKVSKGGPKLGPSLTDPNAPQDQTGSGGGVNDWRFTNNSMPEFAKFLQFQIDRPVNDETGLNGKYSFRLKWASEQTVDKDPNAGPGLFTALEEQIGLKLEATKGSAEVLVVDRVERPSPN